MFGATVVVALATMLIKLVSMAKELVVAWKFGVSDELDAFLVATVVPLFLINLIAGSFNSAVIPTYIHVRDNDGHAAAQRLFSGVTIWSTLLLLAASALVLLFAPLYLPFIALNFSPTKLALTYQLLYIFTPSILFNGLMTTWSATLNAGERFIFAALSPITTPTITILLLLTYPHGGISLLAIGVLLGSIAEVILLGFALKSQGISVWPRWYGFDPHLKTIAGQYAPMMVGALLMGSTALVDQTMAASLGSGSVSALSYGMKLIGIPLMLVSTALGTTVIPYFSAMIARDDWDNIRKVFDRYIALIFVASIPLTLILIIWSTPLIELFFRRGAFTQEDVVVVSNVQIYAALQIPFYIGGILVVRVLSSLRLNNVLMWVAITSVIINITLNYLFIIQLGVAGIALSTSIVYLCSFSFNWFIARRVIQRA